MNLLVVGASGFLGAEVCRQAVAAGHRVVGTYHSAAVAVPGVAPRRLDVTDRAAVRALLTGVRPDAVVSTPYRFDDWAVTADGAAHVASAAAEVGARLVHLSSDALHAGRPEPYADAEAPTPIYPYGAAKAAAETAVRAVDPGALLVRTSLILGEGSKQIQRCRDALAGRATPVQRRDPLPGRRHRPGRRGAGAAAVRRGRPAQRGRPGRGQPRRRSVAWSPAGSASTRPG